MRTDDLTKTMARLFSELERPREVGELEFRGMFGSIAHLAYHLGAIRQINKSARGPKEGSF